VLALFAKFLFAGVVVSYVVVAIRRVFTRRGRGALGPAAVGSVYEMLNEDRRKAVEIIIEERAEESDPEDADGNLPELEKPVVGEVK
jgi:hypothetical protein